jgi:5-methylcytosine-specific restriction endonuclease McrA
MRRAVARAITIKELKELTAAPAACPLCKRPNYKPSDHHLVPRSRGGKVTKTICQDCHSAIHATFSNKELEGSFATIEALLTHEGFAKTVRFIGKQDGRVKTRATRTRRAT